MPVVFRSGYDGIVGVEIGLEPAVEPVFFTRDPAKVDRSSLERLTGRYEMGPLVAQVRIVDDGLVVEVAGGKPTALVARDAAHFEVPGQSGLRVEFVFSSDGPAQQLVVQPSGVFERVAEDVVAKG